MEGQASPIGCPMASSSSGCHSPSTGTDPPAYSPFCDGPPRRTFTTWVPLTDWSADYLDVVWEVIKHSSATFTAE